MFRTVNPKQNSLEMEKGILEFWKQNKIFRKLQEKNKGKKCWSFLDGPITANNPMGVHHAWGRTYKDIFQRYKAMQGFDQRYQNGFDCQGLWVEVEVEKELGFKTKKDIEKYGIEKFVKKCKERVKKYSRIQTEESIRLGQWMDWENSYYTMSEENNYAIWYFLKRCHEKGYLYKGKDVVPWCLRCGTAISQHEILSEEYEEVTHKSIFFKLPIIGRKKTFLLIWTTTPWTLVANVATAVHPDLIYAEIKDKENNTFICLESKSGLVPNGKVVKKFKGKQLKGLTYQGLFDELPKVKSDLKNYGHSIILWDEVSEEEGTGIVHIAPGCGQEDYQLSKQYKLPVIDPIGDEGKYKEGFGFLAGQSVTKINDLIFEDLEKKQAVYKIEDYRHRYPTCWRCKSELVFRLVDEWYISMDKLRGRLMEIAKQVKWIPPFGLERELDWLKNMQDWLISKKRYWGLALPIYECENCHHFEVIGSKKELKEKAVKGWRELEGHFPHRPWIDNVKIKCPKCGKLMSRIPDVGNPWLDAGIVPFSTMEYFTDKEYFKKWFPADLVCESFPGQFRNWFYAIIVMSVVLENSYPTRTIFGYAKVLDEKGEEMHKSKGNAIWFREAVAKIGADVMRWIYAKQNPIYNLNFGYKLAREARKKLLILWNDYSFFETYVLKKEIPNPKSQGPKSKNVLDKWIISCLNYLIGDVAGSLDTYDVATASNKIEEFFIDDLSLWYIRRSRHRFQRPKDKYDKEEAVRTLYLVLLNLVKLIAPILPFTAERIYQELKIEDLPESVHLYSYPKPDKKLIDKDLERKMDMVREIVAKALAERAKCGKKVRQPLRELKIDGEKYRELRTKTELLELIKEEVNVEEVSFHYKAEIEEEIKLDTEITPELKIKGQFREIVRQVQEMRKKAKYSVKDMINMNYEIKDSQSKVKKVFDDYSKDLKRDLLVKSLVKGKSKDVDIEQEIDLNGEKVWVGVKKIEKY